MQSTVGVRQQVRIARNFTQQSIDMMGVENPHLYNSYTTLLFGNRIISGGERHLSVFFGVGNTYRTLRAQMEVDYLENLYQ